MSDLCTHPSRSVPAPLNASSSITISFYSSRTAPHYKDTPLYIKFDSVHKVYMTTDPHPRKLNTKKWSTMDPSAKSANALCVRIDKHDDEQGREQTSRVTRL